MLDHATPRRPQDFATPWDQNAPQQAEAASAEPPDPAPAQFVPAFALHTALAAGLDKFSHGVALIDVAGHTHYANTAARTLFGRLGWPRMESGRPTTPPDWSPSLKQVCLRGRRELMRTTVQGTSMVVVLTPLSTAGKALAFAVFGREELCGSVELQMFALQHQLTHAETQVLRQLTRGLSASAIALEHGVGCNTILTQVAAIRAKTSCPSIRSLMATLARMPPMSPLQPITDVH